MREPSDMPEFYDPELYEELIKPSAHLVIREDHRLSKQEIELVNEMAKQLSENLKKGIYKW